MSRGWLALAGAVLAVVGLRLATADHGPADAAAELIASIPAPAQTPAASTAVGRVGVRALPRARRVLSRDGVTLSRRSFAAARRGSVPFRRVDAGFGVPALPRPFRWMEPGSMNQGALAAGDVNGDGRVDVAAGGELYINVGGRFEAQLTPSPPDLVTALALVDLDADRAPELVRCAWKAGCAILWNRGGTFPGAATALPAAGENAAQALAFADLDRSGTLDVVTGGASWDPTFFRPDSAGTRVWFNDGRRHFAPRTLAGPRGETTSVLVTDFDRDGWPDLWAAHDYDEPDAVYRNDHGRLAVDPSRVSVTTDQSMSIDSGYPANDGRRFYYESSIADKPALAHGVVRVRGAAASCDVYRGEARSACTRVAAYRAAVGRHSVDACRRLTLAVDRRDCAVSAFPWRAVLAGARECPEIPRDYAQLHDICASMRRDRYDSEKSFRSAGAIPQRVDENVLTLEGRRDVTAAAGVAYGGWSWNAQFADLNNDGWQDLFVAQGSRQKEPNASNLLYVNQRGRGFAELAAAAGLEDHNPTGASLFVDIDRDGALDVVTAPFLLQPAAWHNERPDGAGFELALDDGLSGIGATVEIRSPAGDRQQRDIKAGGGYLSFQEPVAHFGLGSWPAVASITVRWPDGALTRLRGLRLRGGRYTLARRPR